MSPVVVAVLAVGVAAGLWLAATAVLPPGTPTEGGDRWRRRRSTVSATELRRRRQLRTRRAGIAAAAGLVVLLWVRVPAAALLAAAMVGIAPALLGGAKEAERAIDRLGALGDWCRRMADQLTIGSGLEQAMDASVRTCPPPIAAEVTALAARLHARWTTADALDAFADDLVDADEVVGALKLAADTRGEGQRTALMNLAEVIEARVRGRRDVEADRAKPRSAARTVLLIIGGTVAVILAAGRSFLSPYRSIGGEIVLLAVGCLFVAALWWMQRLAREPSTPRLLPPASAPAAAAKVGGTATDSRRRTA